MSVYHPEIQFDGTIADVEWYSPWIDMSGFAHITLMSYSDKLYDLYVDWSIDNGLNFDYQDDLSSVIDTHRLSLPVRARFMRIHFVTSSPPQAFRLCIAATI